jgi:hypothetical protein
VLIRGGAVTFLATHHLLVAEHADVLLHLCCDPHDGAMPWTSWRRERLRLMSLEYYLRCCMHPLHLSHLYRRGLPSVLRVFMLHHQIYHQDLAPKRRRQVPPRHTWNGKPKRGVLQADWSGGGWIMLFCTRMYGQFHNRRSRTKLPGGQRR